MVGRYAPNGMVTGLTHSPARLVQTSLEIIPSQVVVHLRGMYPMIGTTLKSENGQVIVRT